MSLVSSAEEAAAAAPPGGSVSVVVSEGLQLLLPLAGLFDVDKELKRLDKQKAKVGADSVVVAKWHDHGCGFFSVCPQGWQCICNVPSCAVALHVPADTKQAQRC